MMLFLPLISVVYGGFLPAGPVHLLDRCDDLLDRRSST